PPSAADPGGRQLRPTAVANRPQCRRLDLWIERRGIDARAGVVAQFAYLVGSRPAVGRAVFDFLRIIAAILNGSTNLSGPGQPVALKDSAMSPPYPHRKREAPRLANTIIVTVLPSDLLKSNRSRPSRWCKLGRSLR